MTEVTQETMPVEAEEGEILEDGEIPDDDDDIVPISQVTDTVTKDEKENKESNQSKFGAPIGATLSSYYPMERDEHFKANKRKKKNNAKKRKRSNSLEAKRRQAGGVGGGDSTPTRNAVDISSCLSDTTFDTVELSDEDEYNFDLIDFDVLMEILGCTAPKDLIDNMPTEKNQLMLRIMKIMRQLHGNDPDTNRRFARLKRRATTASERRNSNPGPPVRPNAYKAICKFYMEGKCHKGTDCLFSHDCVVPKRKDLCKFYLQGFCGKGDSCLFMHSEFPCKFFHTNTECYSGENCRFSHAPLTDDKREILRNYLHSGTLPDDPKPPFRPHFSHDVDPTPKAIVNSEIDQCEVDSPEMDSSFNYETEQLLSKPRPVILGEPTPKIKSSYITWTWQQELKELEKAYTGLKNNLFCINEIFAITEKPTTPRIEDDEEEVEAQILNYYNDMLDTDEMDEMLHIQEIEAHQKKTHEDEATARVTESTADNTHQPNIIEELSEEEKRLIEASAHDEDLRIRPGSFLTGPPAINPVFDQPGYTPASSFFSPSDPFAHLSPFNAPDLTNGNGAMDRPKLVSPFGPDPFGPPPTDFSTNADSVSNMVRHIRNGMTEATSALPTPLPPPAKPEYRDPRLNRVKDPRTLANNTSPNSNASHSVPPMSLEEKSIPKPFIKMCNPNVVIDYKMILVRSSLINYSCYYDLYMSDSVLKNDPRLKKYFASGCPEQKASSNGMDYSYPKMKESENVMSIPSQVKVIPTVPPPLPPATATLPMPNKMLPQADLVVSTKADIVKNDPYPSPPLIRDPRLRAKEEADRRRNVDVPAKAEGDTNSQAEPKVSLDPVGTTLQSEEKESVSPDCESRSEKIGTQVEQDKSEETDSNSASDLSSIPSYAIAAYASNRSWNSTTSNSLYSNYSSTEAPSTSQSLLIDSRATHEEDDDDSDNGQLEVFEEDEEEQGTLKMDLNGEDTATGDTEENVPCKEVKSPTWKLGHSSPPAGNLIDSDNEMEIDLQHQNESEVDSENENELIIASSSEPEDNNNKDCDSQSSPSQSSDSLSRTDYSVNC